MFKHYKFYGLKTHLFSNDRLKTYVFHYKKPNILSLKSLPNYNLSKKFDIHDLSFKV